MSISNSERMLIRRVIEEICNKGRLEVADELFTTEYKNHGGLILDLVQGPEAFKVSIALHRHAFPNIVYAVENVRIYGRMLMCDWVVRRPAFTSGGANDTLIATRELRGQMLCRIIDGQIAESWMRWDRVATLNQLGIVALSEDIQIQDRESGFPGRWSA